MRPAFIAWLFAALMLFVAYSCSDANAMGYSPQAKPKYFAGVFKLKGEDKGHDDKEKPPVKQHKPVKKVQSHHNNNQSVKNNNNAHNTTDVNVVNEGDVIKYDRFPVESAAIHYADNCQTVFNTQMPKLGVGMASRDRVCQWLNLAQAKHVQAANMRCPLPDMNKNTNSPFDSNEYKVCYQRRAELWTEGDVYLRNASMEMCAKGFLKKVWGHVWTGKTKCEIN